MKLLGISRSPRFSPNSTARDAAIFEAVAGELRRAGHEVATIGEDDFKTADSADLVFSMGRDTACLQRLAEAERRGTPVVNSALALLSGTRSALAALFEGDRLPVAPSVAVGPGHDIPTLTHRRYWLKRGDACAQSAGDVRPVCSGEALREALADFAAKGISDLLLSPHIDGDLIKFYGVEGTDFFHLYYPTADGAFSKFGLERYNGRPAGLAFDRPALKACADRAARLSGFIVYGGDAVVCTDGTFRIIDFNDWPSYSLCRDAAACAIATRIGRMAGQGRAAAAAACTAGRFHHVTTSQIE